MTKRLIIVRAGDNSLHPQWGAGDWDLINAYYGDNPHKNALAIKGGKWDGIYKVFAQKPELLDEYQTIWLPDDDIQTNATDIEKIFALHEAHNLSLSQPALSADSYAWFRYLYQNKHFTLRYSNFIEAMVPCFSAALLRKLLPLFENNRTGYMLDKVWHRFVPEPFCAAAVLDAVAVKHTRALNPGALDKDFTARPLAKGEIDKSSQAQDFDRVRHLIPARKLRRPLAYGAILKNNEKIMGEKKLTRFFLSPLNIKQVRYQLTCRATLSPLAPFGL